MATAEAAINFRNPKTIGEFNDMLAELGFAKVSGENLETIRQDHSRERLVRALNTASRDPRAMAFLKNIFAPQGTVSGLDPVAGMPPEVPSDPSQGQTTPPAARSDAPKDPDSPDRKEEAGQAPERISKHVYGGKAALCFSVDETRSGHPTICLEAADSTGPRQYDWNSKISIQLTRQEMPVVAAVFVGLLKKAEYSNHGPNNDKGFSIEDQGDKLFVQVRAKDQKVKAVPVSPEDAYYVVQLFVRQLRKAAPWMGGTDILACLRSVLAARKTG